MESERVAIITKPELGVRDPISAAPGPAPRVCHRRTMSGQALVIFVIALFVLIPLTGLVIDVSWYWANTLRLQRAADAAALAGAVQLPAAPQTGVSLALAEAKKNGYDTTAQLTCPNNPPVMVVPSDGKLEICAKQDTNPNQMDVSITAPVQTFFARIVGITSFQATVAAQAVYQLPVPMGSPENYYGIYCLTKASPADVGCTNPNDLVPDVNPNAAANPNCATGPAAPTGYLCSKGFWGAVITKGGNQQNGDAYLPANNIGYNPSNNVLYNQNGATGYVGYSYIVDLTNASGGAVSIFDPTFCSMAGNGNQGHYGTGDHWIAGTTNSVSTYFNLYNFVNPYNPADDGAAIATSGNLFANENASDHSTTFGKDTSGTNDCQWVDTSGHPDPTGKLDPHHYGDGRDYHNRWWTLATGLAPGKYRVQVTTTDVSTSNGGTTVADANVNANVNAENMFGIEATSTGGQPFIYANGKMAAYNTLYSPSGLVAQQFYLAQIKNDFGQVNGKTVEIRLFDPGDVNGDAYMSVLQPSATTGTNCGGPSPTTCPAGYTAATFSYWADSNCVAGKSDQCGTSTSPITNRTYFQTNKGSGSSSSFNSTWVTMDISLGSTYPKNPPDNGWWQIQYLVGNGNDTTTWQVNILGNPVHLINP